jgi:hypothetical protein
MRSSKQLEYIVSPYLATTQINYLYTKCAVQAVYGPLDLLLFPKLPIILSYDDKQFQWTSDEILIEKLELSKEKLEEYCLLWNYPIDTFDYTKDLLNATEVVSNKPQVKFALTRLEVLYKCPIIFDNECICRSMVKAQKLPKEIEELLGIKLPAKCYLYLFLGLVSGKLLGVVSSGKLFNVDVSDCKLKVECYSFLITLLKGSISLRSYIEKLTKIFYIDKVGSADTILVNEPSKDLYWNASKDKISKELARQNNKVTVLFCIRWISEVAGKGNCLKKIDKFIDIRQARDLLCHVLLIYLEQRNYISPTKGILPLGEACKAFPIDFQDEGLIFIELFVNDKLEFEGKKLIAVVFALVSINGVGEVSEELISYSLVVKNVWNIMRELVEGILFSLFCSIDESKAFDIEEFEKAFGSLPFKSKPNFLLGSLMLWMLNEPESKNLVKEAGKIFSLGENTKTEIMKGYTFWKSIMLIVSTLYTHKDINQDKYQHFINANKLLEDKLEALEINN